MITQEYLKSILNYNPETGVWLWLRGKRTWEQSVAGCLNLGYRRINIDGKFYRSSRLAWLYMTGEWPECQVDHKNTIKDDDRWENLRKADENENQRNKGLMANNTSGYKGVYFNKRAKMWLAQIRMGNGKRKSIGLYETAEQAGKAYELAALQYHGEYARIK